MNLSKKKKKITKDLIQIHKLKVAFFIIFFYSLYFLGEVFNFINIVIKEKLQICIEKIEDIMGSAYQEREMVNAVIHNNYNVEAALDTLLNKSMYLHTSVYRQYQLNPSLTLFFDSHVWHIACIQFFKFQILNGYNSLYLCTVST